LRSHSASFGHKGSHYLPSNSSVEDTHSSDTTNTAKAQISSSPSQNPVKIGILMIYSNSDGNWGNDLMQRVIQNREDYAKRHQYTVVTANELVDKTRPAAWSKLRAMDHYLYQFDYLMYIDMDVVIMHHSTPLSVFIDLSPSSDFIMTEDWNGVNTGIWLAKNTDFAHWFLKTAWNQTQLIPKKSKEGIPYPFEYEQRAFHFLLNTEIWQQRRLPHYRGDIEELRKHYFLLPQCAFNSYIMHPWYWHGDREKSQYVEGDFLVHFAGKKGQIKTNLMKHFLYESSKKSL
jgi:mannan polymerase II complex MNN10 subunit